MRKSAGQDCLFLIWGLLVVIALSLMTIETSAMEIDEIRPQEWSEIVADPHHLYTIHMGSTMDGDNTRDPIGYSVFQQVWEPNVYVLLENIGDETLVNPWLVINGKRDWRSVDAILGGILNEEMSDAEQARAIWEFGRRYRYHYTSGTDDVKDVVKMVNIYGYALCWDTAYTMSNLWQAAGLKIRRGMPHGHCTTEVYYDGRYHLLDSDEHLLVLMRDNQTIAGEEEISRDHDLMKRSHAYGILQEENRRTSEFSASLFCYLGPRSGGRPYIGGHRMDHTLRPGEALRWEWADRGRYHGVWKRPQRLANGRHHFRPRLDAGFAKWAEVAINLRYDGGVALAEAGSEANLVYRLTTPYLFVGGRVEAELLLGSEPWMVEIQTGNGLWVEAGELSPGGALVTLDAHIPSDGPPIHTYLVRLRGTTGGLASLHIESDLQMAPLSLPGLTVGNNQIVYTDANEGRRQVRITHRWNERSDSTPPPAPARPLFPEHNGEIEGTQFTFRWDPVPEAADYHFELSRHSDMQYALSPVFEKLISKTPSAGQAQWRIPEPALLNPDEHYYWRVRSRNADDLWGPWSAIWSFTPHAPGVPQHIALDTDWNERTITLSWQPNLAGNHPAHYEIYGADERGFTVSREPFLVYMGKKAGQVEFPANIQGTTKEQSMVVVSPDLDQDKGKQPCFFRVVSVDENGVRSGASDYAEAPHPFIYSQPPDRLVAGQIYQYQVRALASIGDLRSITGPDIEEHNEEQSNIRYQDSFRDGDDLVFLLDEGPTMIALDRETGLMTFRPQTIDIGTHTVTIRVQSRYGGGVDIQGFDIKVIRETGPSKTSAITPGT